MGVRLYLAGPMSGLPHFNFPAFERWASALRVAGFEVLSPAEADPEDVQEVAAASVTGDPSELPDHAGPLPTALRNVECVWACDGLALMPGWHQSSGSQHELATAHRFKIPTAPASFWLALGPRGALRAARLEVGGP